MNEITATAKATEEVAKASGRAIDAMNQLGSFTAKVMKEPIEETVGILTDRLRFFRWERQLRLYDRWKEIIDERNIDLETASLAPKLGLPIIENATLEENDYLQDIWARLLATSMDPKRREIVRSAFIEIAKQLEAIDASVLDGIHNLYFCYEQDTGKENPVPSKVEIRKSQILAECEIDHEAYEEVIDNLFRLRLCTPYVVTEEFDVVRNGGPDKLPFSAVFQYESICITALGLSFIAACIK